MLTVDLSPPALEVEAARMLRETLGSRGLTVRHNGTPAHHAPGGVADIDLFNDDVDIAVETTKLLKVAQTNNEATPVPAHLDDLITSYPAKSCFSLFVSPQTFHRWLMPDRLTLCTGRT